MEQTAKIGLGMIDRLVIVGAWLVSCAAVYGLGFYTGSHTQDRLRSDEDRIVRLPVTTEPPAVGERAKAADDLTFWTMLDGGRRSKPGDGIPAAHAPAAVAALPPESPAPARPATAPAKPASKPASKPAGGAPAAKRTGTPSAGTKTASTASGRKPASVGEKPATTAAKKATPG